MASILLSFVGALASQLAAWVLARWLVRRRARLAPGEWQRYPWGYWVLIGLAAVALGWISLWLFLNPDPALRPTWVAVVTGLLAIVLASFSAQLHSYRLRTEPDLLQIRSLFGDRDVRPEDIEVSRIEVHRGVVRYKVRLRDGSRFAVSGSLMLLGEFESVLHEHEDPHRRWWQ